MVHLDSATFFNAQKKWAIKTWINFKCMLLSKRNKYEKSTHSMITILWHSGKSKTIEEIDQWLPGVGKRDEYGEHRGILGQWDYSV